MANLNLTPNMKEAVTISVGVGVGTVLGALLLGIFGMRQAAGARIRRVIRS